MRVAAIDIGTNTTLLTVADTDGRTLDPILECAEITRLGRDLARTGVISPEGLDGTRAVLRSYVADCRRLAVTRVRAIATAAMRSATNADAVRAAFAEDGVDVEVIGGDREAALTFLSALRDFGRDGRPLSVIDVGGGSTEVILGDAERISWRKSYPVGAVRLKEQFMPSDPPTLEEIARALLELEGVVHDVPAAPNRLVVAVAGTPTTLAAVSKKVDIAAYSRAAVHGTVLTAADLDALLKMLQQMPLEGRRKVVGLEPKRADVIDAGIWILSIVLHHLGARSFTVSDGGVRWGLLWEMAGEIT